MHTNRPPPPPHPTLVSVAPSDIRASALCRGKEGGDEGGVSRFFPVLETGREAAMYSACTFSPSLSHKHADSWGRSRWPSPARHLQAADGHAAGPFATGPASALGPGFYPPPPPTQPSCPPHSRRNWPPDNDSLPGHHNQCNKRRRMCHVINQYRHVMCFENVPNLFTRTHFNTIWSSFCLFFYWVVCT